MTKKPRIPRTAAFKKKIALEALREDKTINQLASEHGIHPLQIGKWKKELIDRAESLFESEKDRKQDDKRRLLSFRECLMGAFPFSG